MTNKTLRQTACFLALALFALILIILNINSGSLPLSPGQIFQILSSPNAADTSGKILLEVRMPRIIAAALLGGSLSVAGFLLQTFFHNPIAGPFVLGISSGAKLAVALFMVFSIGRGAMPGSGMMVAAAFAGAILSMSFVLILSLRMRNMAFLVVCGVMIGYICSAITDFVVAFADDADIVNLHNWALGSFSGTSWADVRTIALVTLPCLALCVLLSKPMGAYQLGEAYARNMGVDILWFRVELILLSSMMSALVTAFAGPISFVGIAVPHLVRNLFGTAKPLIIIPASFLGGACFCLACDLVARLAFAPTELSISSVTAAFGAPIVIWVLLTRRSH
ncbi:MAG: iron ABC transporter permease [Lachnospiraceae bacterium]|nr:iron ABC transporter permease [Lachnospiraceae bacterium]